MNADDGDKLILAVAYVVIGGFITMGVLGVITGGAHPAFDLLGITAGVIVLIWLGRNI